MKITAPHLALLCLALAACSGGDDPAPSSDTPPWVRTQEVRGDAGATLSLSGTVRARYEIPIAFEVSGRITARAVDAGQRVDAGQLLFQLDPRDLDADLRAALAEQAAADTALEIASEDHRRNGELLARKFISDQVLERSALALREARTRLDAARARTHQAQNRLGYATLKAAEAGVLMEVSGDPGQVVAAGQPVAVLARDGEREIEVYLPEGAPPAREGKARLDDGTEVGIHLRETARAADPASRTWRARYRVADNNPPALPPGSVVRIDPAGAAGSSSRTCRARYRVADHNPPALPLGWVVRVDLDGAGAAESLVIPIAARDERGHVPRVWRVVEGRAQPLPVTVLAMDTETVRIRAELAEGSPIIALGTHLLKPGMRVRELAP